MFFRSEPPTQLQPPRRQVTVETPYEMQRFIEQYGSHMVHDSDAPGGVPITMLQTLVDMGAVSDDMLNALVNVPDVSIAGFHELRGARTAGSSRAPRTQRPARSAPSRPASR